MTPGVRPRGEAFHGPIMPPMRYEDIDWSAWVPKEEATLLYVVQGGRMLLIHKKRGLGAGKLNGAGGRIQHGETPHEAAVRETKEELRVEPEGVEKWGEVLFQVTDGMSIRIHVFTATGCRGEPQETDEAVPLWVPADEIPYDRMWEDDRFWVPLMLRGERFEARTLFDGDRLIGHEVEVKPGGSWWT